MSQPQDSSDQEASASAAHAGVDDALARLAELDELSVSEHAAVFEEIHQTLRRTLRGYDSGGVHTDGVAADSVAADSVAADGPRSHSAH